MGIAVVHKKKRNFTIKSVTFHLHKILKPCLKSQVFFLDMNIDYKETIFSSIRLQRETMGEHQLAVQLIPADHMEQSAEIFKKHNLTNPKLIISYFYW